MLVLYGAGFWLFCRIGLRQTPRIENILKVPRFFMCVYLNKIKEQRSNPKSRKVSREKDLWKEHRNEKISYNNTV